MKCCAFLLFIGIAAGCADPAEMLPPPAEQCGDSDSCAPRCDLAAGDLNEVHVVARGQGGLEGLAGVVGLVATPTHFYVASAGEGRVTIFRRQAAGHQAVGFVAAPGVQTLAIHEGALWIGAQDATTRWMVGPEGALASPETAAGPAVAMVRVNDQLARADGAQIHVSGPPIDFAAHRMAAYKSDLYAVGASLRGWRVDVELTTEHTTIASLLTPEDVAISPDGARVYVADFCAHAIATFERDAETGVLTAGSTVFADGVPSCDGLLGNDEALFDEPYAVFPTAVGVMASGEVVSAGFLGDRLTVWQPTETGLHKPRYLPTAAPEMDFDVETEDEDFPGQWWLGLRHGAVMARDGADLFVGSRVAGAVHHLKAGATQQLLQSGDGGVRNLPGAYNLRLSPDGRHVYVAARNHGSPAAFSVCPQTGRLVELEPVSIPDQGDFQGAITNLSVTHDGTLVLAVDAEKARLEALKRDEVTGVLTWHEHLELGDCDGAPAFPVVVESSPDGRDVYVGDFHFEGASCVHHFRRDGAQLTLSRVMDDEPLAGVESIAITADGRHVYTAAHVAEAVTLWQRNAETGALELPQPTVMASLAGAEFVALSPDEATVYVTSPTVNSVNSFARNAQTGTLEHMQTLFHGSDTALEDTAGLAISPDGDTLYVAARVSSSITRLDRGPDGQLSVGRHITGDNIYWVNGLALHPSGRFLIGAAVRASTVTSHRIVACGGDGCGGSCP